MRLNYPPLFSFIFRIAGIAALIVILLSNFFNLSISVKDILLRIGILAIVLLSWRFIEEKKREEQPRVSLVFYGLFFLGIANAFLKIIKLQPFLSLLFLFLFCFVVLIEVILLFNKKISNRSDVIIFPLLGFLSFLTLTQSL